jgi:hypothetical protein
VASKHLEPIQWISFGLVVAKGLICHPG